MEGAPFHFDLRLAVSIDQFPALHRNLSDDGAFRDMLTDNLERVVQEYLSMAELEITKREEEV